MAPACIRCVLSFRRNVCLTWRTEPSTRKCTFGIFWTAEYTLFSQRPCTTSISSQIALVPFDCSTPSPPFLSLPPPRWSDRPIPQGAGDSQSGVSTVAVVARALGGIGGRLSPPAISGGVGGSNRPTQVPRTGSGGDGDGARGAHKMTLSPTLGGSAGAGEGSVVGGRKQVQRPTAVKAVNGLAAPSLGRTGKSLSFGNGAGKRRRWYLGIQSKKEAAHVMTEVYLYIYIHVCTYFSVRSRLKGNLWSRFDFHDVFM